MEFKYQGFEFTIDKLALKGMLFVAVSGAHAYGWARDDSDLDVRQVWFPDVAQAVSPFFKAKTLMWTTQNIDRMTYDFVSYPISEYLHLVAKGNGNIIENLFQEKVWENKQLVSELQEIVIANLHKGLLQHYLGYSLSLAKDMGNPSRIKRYGLDKLLLCRYRVLLAGLILEQKHKIVYNLEDQAKLRKTENCLPLLNQYKNKVVEITGLRSDAMNEVIDLHEELEHVIENSKLPDSKIGAPIVQLDRWLVKYYK